MNSLTTTKPNGQFGTAAILAGGLSHRMGYDKFDLAIDGQRLLDILIRMLRQTFGQIIVVVNDQTLQMPPDVFLTKDIFPGQGPLAGLHAALKIADSEYVYLMACDMPNFYKPYVNLLTGALANRPSDACCCRRDGRAEPFHAFYHRRIVPVIEELLLSGQRRAQDLLTHLDCLYIDEAVVAPSSERLFFNINTPQELAEYVHLKKGG